MAESETPAVENTATVEPIVLEPGGEAAYVEGESDYLPSEVWLLLALVVLFALVFKTAKKTVIGGLDARRDRIKNELEEARALHEEAKTALADMQRKQRDALKDAEEIIVHARTEAGRLHEQSLKQLDEQLARRERLAHERIAQAEAAAIAAVRNDAVRIAIDATEAVLTEQMAQKSNANPVLDKAISDLGNRLN